MTWWIAAGAFTAGLLVGGAGMVVLLDRLERSTGP